MAWVRVNSAATASTYCPNRGYYELASGVEIVSYFDKLMQERFLPSARVQYLTFSAQSTNQHMDSRRRRVRGCSSRCHGQSGIAFRCGSRRPQNSFSRHIARTAQEIAIPSPAQGRVLPFPRIRSQSLGQIARTGQCDQAAAAICRVELAPGARALTETVGGPLSDAFGRRRVILSALMLIRVFAVDGARIAWRKKNRP